jgi:hypothetical protein
MKKSSEGVIAFLNPPISARTLANMLHNLPEYMLDIDDAENIVIYKPPREDMGQ